MNDINQGISTENLIRIINANWPNDHFMGCQMIYERCEQFTNKKGDRNQ